MLQKIMAVKTLRAVPGSPVNLAIILVSILG